MFMKILKIIVVLIVLLAIALGVYWFFVQKNNGTGDTMFSNLSVGDIFPFGQGTVDAPVTTPTPIVTNPNDTNPTGIPVIPPSLWQISTQPQSGAIAFNASGTPTVRYIDKATGNAFESALRLVGTNRITNTTIPKVYEALWQPQGSAVILRFLIDDNETIRSAFGKLVTTSATSTTEESSTLKELSVSFLADNITNLSVDPATGAVAYVSKNPAGAKVYVTTSTVSSPKQIFESEIRDISVSWVNSSTLALSTKPSESTPGQFYFLNTTSGKLQRVIGELNGLTALSNSNGTDLVYSWVTGNSTNSALYNTKTGQQTSLRTALIPEKCVFAKKSSNLFCANPKSTPSKILDEDWYKGKISFNDSFWKINTTTGAIELMNDPKIVAGTEIDAINLMLDPNEEHLIFTNKKDSHLWALKVGN